MKVGDTVKLADFGHHELHEAPEFGWDRLGLVLGFEHGLVQVFWGEDFPCEDEYHDQLAVL